MNCFQLPPDEFIKFAEQLKKDYGLVIVERPATTAVDESKYGAGWAAWNKTYVFSVINKKGCKEHITIQNGTGETLYAVTKQQHKCWKNWKVVSAPLGWCFGRLISCWAQLAHKHNLISPVSDLHKLQYFWRNLFRRGEMDAQEECKHSFNDK